MRGEGDGGGRGGGGGGKWGGGGGGGGGGEGEGEVYGEGRMKGLLSLYRFDTTQNISHSATHSHSNQYRHERH